MYRFLLRPAWLALHLLVVVLVVLFLAAMAWQWDRLGERRDRNDEIRAREAAPAVPVGERIDPGASTAEGAAEQFWPVTATGTYRVADGVLLRGRDRDGVPGFWVYTPLDLGDGTAVAVNRGWIPAGAETDGSDVPFETPTGPVTVTGLTERSYPDPRPAGDRKRTVAHLDLDWYDDQVALDLFPVALRLEAQEPPPVDDRPAILPPPELSDGPHLSYAGQWLLFALVVGGSYPFLLRRVARQRAREAAAPVATGAGEPGASPS